MGADRRFPAGVFLLLCLTGCATHTAWDVYGAWSARTTLPGEAGAHQSGSFYILGGTRFDDPIRLCDISEISVYLPSSTRLRGMPASIMLHLVRPLCRTGVTEITGGRVFIWEGATADTSAITTIASDAWTVTGEMNVIQYRNFGLPNLNVGDPPKTIETAAGTFTITATDTSGAVIRLEDGVCTFEVLAHEYRDTVR